MMNKYCEAVFEALAKGDEPRKALVDRPFMAAQQLFKMGLVTHELVLTGTGKAYAASTGILEDKP
jgi:hypothetical protein